jgi:hypothetical protein
VILAVDIEDSTMRTNTAKAGLRHVMYALLEEALIISGVKEDHRDSFVDRGDGILVLIHPVDEVPKTLLLNTVVPTLETLLCQHEEEFPDQRLRLRAVVHAGEVHYDGRGCFGESLDVAFRLLNATEVKQRFRQTRAPMLLVVSDDIHQTVVRHGYAGIDEQEFVPAAFVNVGGTTRLGWVKRTSVARGANAPRGSSLLEPGPS